MFVSIDCDKEPVVPNNRWEIAYHQKGGQLNLDPMQIVFHHQKSGQKAEGYKLRKELENEAILNACVLDYLLSYPHLIPESWKKDENAKTQYIFFWGTIYRSSDGELFVRCLGFDGEEWCSETRWLGYGWSDNHPAALRAQAIPHSHPKSWYSRLMGAGLI